MAEKLVKLLSYSVHKPTPKKHSRFNKKGKLLWFVHLHAVNNVERIDVELRNLQPVDLALMLPHTMEHLIEIIGELSPIIDGGFTVYQREED